MSAFSEPPQKCTQDAGKNSPKFSRLVKEHNTVPKRLQFQSQGKRFPSKPGMTATVSLPNKSPGTPQVGPQTLSPTPQEMLSLKSYPSSLPPFRRWPSLADGPLFEHRPSSSRVPTREMLQRSRKKPPRRNRSQNSRRTIISHLGETEEGRIPFPRTRRTKIRGMPGLQRFMLRFDGRQLEEGSDESGARRRRSVFMFSEQASH